MIGETISHYKILEKLDEGGMGVVYKAEDTKLKRTATSKFQTVELTRKYEVTDHFALEVKVASVFNPTISFHLWWQMFYSGAYTDSDLKPIQQLRKLKQTNNLWKLRRQHDYCKEKKMVFKKNNLLYPLGRLSKRIDRHFRTAALSLIFVLSILVPVESAFSQTGKRADFTVDDSW